MPSVNTSSATPTNTVSPLPPSTKENFSNFLNNLANRHGAKNITTWHNNNWTLKQQAYTIDLKNLDAAPAKIIKELAALKLLHKDQTAVAVPVAGWENKKISFFDGFFSTEGKEERLLKEYARSFSLSAVSTAKNASIVLRASKESQKMEIIREGDQSYLRVSAGVRITDADKFLFERGFALPPNMPTLHVASLVGAAANGCYGPARDYKSMTTDIVEMKIINAKGEHLTLSAKENADLFEVLRDGHLGVCFVSEITLKIEPRFLMKRHTMLFQDVDALKQKMQKDNLIDKEHFIAMYIPVGINDKDHTTRVQITNFERTNDKPTAAKSQAKKDVSDYFSLILTETGEPLINLISKTPQLRKYWPFILESAALKTFGIKKETIEIDYSAPIAHLFGTYTDLPITDINWLIQVENSDDARELFLALLDKTEKKLIEQGKTQQYPILNAFARYLKGISYPEGRGGIAATAVDKEGQSILSFEIVTYAPLADTLAFQDLQKEILDHLDKSGRKYNYHPGKNMPDNIRSLTQIIKETDIIGRQRLENFKNAVYTLHGGKENVPYSPFLTPQKKVFLGLDSSAPIKEALEAIVNIAKENEVKNAPIIKKATKQISKVDAPKANV